MMTLIDMMRAAQDGEAIEILARQYRLTQAQATKAIEALLPAFSQGFKQSASDAMGLGALLEAFAGGGYKPFFDNVGSAFGPMGVSAGNELVSQLFGSKEVVCAIAAHAARATGLAQETLREMMAPLALIAMGGLSKETTGETPTPGANVLADFMNQMMRVSGFTPVGTKPLMPDAADNPFGRLIKQMWGVTPGAPQRPALQDPLADMVGRVMTAGLAMMPGGEEPSGGGQPPKMPSGRARNTYDDLFEQMFETGRQARADYEKGIAAILEQYRPREAG